MEPLRMNASFTLPAGKIDSFEEERAALRLSFLKKEGFENQPLIPLPVDASKRRYFRLPQALLMDAPPPHEKTDSFVFIAKMLNKVGLSVPLIYASDPTHGFLLIEDLGELTYRKSLERGLSEELLYKEALRGLSHLHQNMIQNKDNFPLYTLDAFLTETEVFLEWYGLDLSEKTKKDFRHMWQEAYENQPSLPQSFVMRDVLIDNLLWLPSREEGRRCGFIDFQDCLWGPITYDLVSLLEDARRDITPQFARESLEIYFRAFPHLSREELWESYSLWGAQRSTKILGVFSRLAKRDGKSHYLSHLPRVWKILERDLQHPSLKDVRQWFHVYAGLK